MNTPKKILLVDDDEEILKLLTIRFKQEGFEVITAVDGEGSIKRAEEEAPHLVVLDIVMPGMDGYTVLKEMRRNPKTRDIPVIMLSGKEEEKVRDLFAFQHISDYIEKPFELDDLVSRVNKVLNL